MRQICDFGADSCVGPANAVDFERGEVVHHNDVAGAQGRNQLLLQIGQARRAVHRSIDGDRSGQADVFAGLRRT